ncbi:DUF4278 domain-containing protein [Synechococcus sp. MU1655]|uniref:DUF4278 domain-containing protein n=1 Tax=Synechococcus sp. MU1655 TaxID=2508355 RepID=UPI002025E7AD|nr:DUF4278 domain-containing protein [Synechococcus sp. MU1655]
MTTLLYRGHTYQQHNDAAHQANVQLNYCRSVSVYPAHKVKAQKTSIQLTYRGL